MNEKTLEYAPEQLRQPALMGREHDEVEIEKKLDEKRKEVRENEID